jgi:hypothetical protein
VTDGQGRAVFGYDRLNEWNRLISSAVPRYRVRGAKRGVEPGVATSYLAVLVRKGVEVMPVPLVVVQPEVPGPVEHPQ